eukprot:5713807-Alexandrium_andersonii.AAC.1
MQGHPAVVRLAPGLEHSRLSGVAHGAVQRTISGQLVMTKPELAGTGNGLELWRLLIREHGVPEQAIVQREYQKRWAYPRQCKTAAELRARLPQWE